MTAFHVIMTFVNMTIAYAALWGLTFLQGILSVVANRNIVLAPETTRELLTFYLPYIAVGATVFAWMLYAFGARSVSVVVALVPVGVVAWLEVSSRLGAG